MTRQELLAQIVQKKSFLCVGLDTDLDKIPPALLGAEDPIFEFNKGIIDATKHLAVAYKPNVAFYEALGSRGWESLKKTLAYIPKEIFTIADAKRGDIGNTTQMYARAFFEDLDFDAVTLSPYMGADAVMPYLAYENKTAIVLGLTSNSGSQDFQMLESNGLRLFEHVLTTASKWGNTDNLMFVVGGTHPRLFADVRKLVPEHFLLVPGIGAQGGDLEQVAQYGLNSTCGLLVNSARGIIYAGNTAENYQQQARQAALQLQQGMQQILQLAKLI